MTTKTQPKEFLEKLNRPCDKKRTVIGYSALCIGFGILLYTIFFGTNIWDESFYLTIPYRVYLGDALFVDEWHVSLLSSFLQYLPLLAFVKITGSTDGIILFFRILFCISQFSVSVFVFEKLKKYGFTAAILSALMYMMYVPEFILTLDYYTMSLMPLVIICMLLFTDEKISTFRLIFSGILLACCVVAEPIMALLFLFYSITVLIFCILRKTGKTTKDIVLLSFKAWRYIIYGIIIVFIPFILYILSRESFSELLANGFNIFLSKEYAPENLFNFNELFYSLKEYFPAVFIIFLWLAVVAFTVFTKKANNYSVIYLSLTGITTAIIYVIIISINLMTGKGMSILYYPFIGFFLSLGLFLLTKNKKYNFLIIWLVGFGYIVCLATTSEALNEVGMYGAVISDLVLLPVLFQLAEEIFSEIYIKKRKRISIYKKVIPVFVLLAAAIQICDFSGAHLVCDTCRKSWVGTDDSQTVVCTDGPYKYIRIAECQNELYNSIVKDIEKIEATTDGQYTVASHNATWLTLCSERRPATFTSWYIESDVETFSEYYEKTGITPEAIYVPDADFHSITENDSGYCKEKEQEQVQYFLDLFDCTVEEGNAGKILWVNGWKNSGEQ